MKLLKWLWNNADTLVLILGVTLLVIVVFLSSSCQSPPFYGGGGSVGDSAGTFPEQLVRVSGSGGVPILGSGTCWSGSHSGDFFTVGWKGSRTWYACGWPSHLTPYHSDVGSVVDNPSDDSRYNNLNLLSIPVVEEKRYDETLGLYREEEEYRKGQWEYGYSSETRRGLYGSQKDVGPEVRQDVQDRRRSQFLGDKIMVTLGDFLGNIGWMVASGALVGGAILLFGVPWLRKRRR